jgi:BirA family biotin operon repressor/biotin-[acetyl-CoA-carboxylase] ligase
MPREDPDVYPVQRLRASLRPWRLHYVARVGSTNDLAASLRHRRRLVAPAIVLTSRQVAGRGRGGNAWVSPRGCLTATFALPLDDARPPQQLPLAVGVALRRVAAWLGGSDDVRVKWPNDLWHDDLKLAGILCERVQNVDLVGVGLNVNLLPRDLPRPLRDRVTSLRAIAGRPLPIGDVLQAIADELRATLLAGSAATTFPHLLRAFARHDALAGRRVRVSVPGESAAVLGVCDGVDSVGRLLVRDRGSVRRIIAGHVELDRD